MGFAPYPHPHPPHWLVSELALICCITFPRSLPLRPLRYLYTLRKLVLCPSQADDSPPWRRGKKAPL